MSWAGPVRARWRGSSTPRRNSLALRRCWPPAFATFPSRTLPPLAAMDFQQASLFRTHVPRSVSEGPAATAPAVVSKQPSCRPRAQTLGEQVVRWAWRARAIGLPEFSSAPIRVLRGHGRRGDQAWQSSGSDCLRRTRKQSLAAVLATFRQLLYRTRLHLSGGALRTGWGCI